MRLGFWFLAAAIGAPGLLAQDAREIVRRSVELDQANWLRMKDYTWMAREVERNLDGNGRVKSEDSRAWETVVLSGEPHRRILERNGKPLSASDARKEQEKLDKVAAKLSNETPEERKKRLAKLEEERRKDREFLREIPDAFDLTLQAQEKVDGHDVWVINATPRAGFQPHHRDAKQLSKIKGTLWIDQREYQWVRLRAETTGTISFGLFLVRLDPGAILSFEQTRINDEIWLPKRQVLRGAARIGLVKKFAVEQEVTWSNYRKFQVNSSVVVIGN